MKTDIRNRQSKRRRVACARANGLRSRKRPALSLPKGSARARTVQAAESRPHTASAPTPQVPVNPSARPATAERTHEPTEAQPYGGDSAFHLYIREIGQTKLLTPQEEIELARRIQAGDASAREHM